MMRSSGSRGTARAGTRRIDASPAAAAPAAFAYSGATSVTSCPSATRSRRKVSMDVETPFTRGKYTSEILRIRIARSGRPGEGIAGQVLGPARGGRHIVFDANTAERAQRLDHGPGDVRAPRIGMRRGQQGIDEVDAGLHRHHHAGLEHAGEPQIGMSFGTVALMSLLIAHDAAHVMYLQTEQMAYAMGKEDPGDAGFQGCLARKLGQPDVVHDVAQNAMRGQMYLPIIAAGGDLRTERQLRLIQRLDEVRIRARS